MGFGGLVLFKKNIERINPVDVNVKKKALYDRKFL